MSKTITMSLSASSIQDAINELKKYRDDLNSKCRLFCERLAELGETRASANIAMSPLGNYVSVSTNITPEQMGCKAVLIATGGEVDTAGGYSILPLMMIEFGAGIHYNSTQNPKADDFGMGVGTYPGQTHAFEDGWYYMGEDGEWHYTHGVKATMPMYSADIEMIMNIKKIAAEVFRS